MRRKKTTLALVAALCVAGAITTFRAGQADELTPAEFLFERRTRISTEYMTDVLTRGDAADLIPAVDNVHTQLKNGEHRDKLEELRQNLGTLISVTEGLIGGQQHSDNLGDDADAAQQQIQLSGDAILSAFQAEFPDAEPVPGDYVPPVGAKVYNEKKKDLLQIAYDMKETLDGIGE